MAIGRGVSMCYGEEGCIVGHLECSLRVMVTYVCLWNIISKSSACDLGFTADTSTFYCIEVGSILGLPVLIEAFTSYL